MIFILGSFFVGVSLIKIFFSKNNKEEKSIEDLNFKAILALIQEPL